MHDSRNRPTNTSPPPIVPRPLALSPKHGRGDPLPNLATKARSGKRVNTPYPNLELTRGGVHTRAVARVQSCDALELACEYADHYCPSLLMAPTFICLDDYLFILVLIGDSGVGKSCLLLRFAVRCLPFNLLGLPCNRKGPWQGIMAPWQKEHEVELLICGTMIGAG